MNMKRALRESYVACTASANRIVRAALNERHAEAIVDCGLRHHAANRRGAVADNCERCAPKSEILFIGCARRPNGIGRPPERIMRKRRPAESAVEAEIQPVVHFVAFAPPEEALRVAKNAGAWCEFDKTEQVVDVCAREQNRVREIHGERSRGVVAQNHVAAEERRAAANVEKAGATRAGQTQDARNDVRRTDGNIREDNAFVAACSPGSRGTGLSQITLA